MEKDWKRVFLTGQEYLAIIAKDVLADNGINAVLLNQKDTAYQTFGDIEVYVNENDEIQALEILKELKK